MRLSLISLEATTVAFMIILSINNGFACDYDSAHKAIPVKGLIPNDKVAVAVAEPILSNIYGSDNIASEQPLRATLKNGVWTVTGTLQKRAIGGTAIILIRMQDGQVLHVCHGE